MTEGKHNSYLSLWSNGAGKGWREQSVLVIPLTRNPSRHGWAASVSHRGDTHDHSFRRETSMQSSRTEQHQN